MKKIKITLITCLALLFATGSFAQRGRGGYSNRGGNNNYHNNGNYSQQRSYSSRGNNNYHSNGSYWQNRSYASVNVGPRYNNYRPYYRSSPAYKYRPVYHPVYYRSPRPYVRYGPSFGFRLNILPFGYSRIYVGGSPYYYNDGIYYRNYSNSSSYEVVAPPLDAIVSKLPANATATVIDGQKYYQVGGTFYQEEFNNNDQLTYRVVGTDGVINTTSQVDDQQQQEATQDATVYQQEIPALGNRYDELPADSKVQVINQQKYYTSPGGVYYKEVIEGDKIRYEVTNVQ